MKLNLPPCLPVIAALTFVMPAQAQLQPVPEPAAIIARLKAGHPRLICSAADFAALRVQTAKNERLKKWHAALRAAGAKTLAEEPSKYEIPDGKRLLATSRRVMGRVSQLALLYRLDGDEKWAERAWRELDAAAQFKDWNPSHFLDTGEMTYAFALGYDWLFEYWTAEQKATLKKSIVELGLKPAQKVYAGGGWWAKAEHNWNQVCNGGIAAGALAIGVEEPALCGEILQSAIKSLPLAMKHFAPDGAWNEGPGYWHYATQYNVAVLAALDSALGTDFGLAQIPGFDKTGDFPPYFTSPAGKVFNYADAKDSMGGAPQMFWLATKFNQPGWAAWQTKWADEKPNAFDLIWGARWFAGADGSPKTPPPLDALPLGRHFREAEVVAMRSAWDDPKAISIGFKAGDNKANHSHLDLGSFVLDALGQRFILDLGSDDYNLPDYFRRKRWTYYRLRAEGQNTLVINPDTGPEQDPNALTRVTKFQEKDCCTLAVADLTAAYKKHAASVKRGITLADGAQVLVQDEITAKAPARVFWFAHTPAKIALAADGKSATLTLNKQTLLARVLGPAEAKFSVLPAAPLPTSPNPANQRDNKGIQRLTVELNNITETRLRVLFTPLRQGETAPAAPEELALAQW